MRPTRVGLRKRKGKYAQTQAILLLVPVMNSRMKNSKASLLHSVTKSFECTLLDVLVIVQDNIIINFVVFLSIN